MLDMLQTFTTTIKNTQAIDDDWSWCFKSNKTPLLSQLSSIVYFFEQLKTKEASSDLCKNERHVKKIQNTLTSRQTIDGVDLEINYTPLHWASECKNVRDRNTRQSGVQWISTLQHIQYMTESAFSCDRNSHHLSDLLDFIECQMGKFDVSKATRHPPLCSWD